MENDLTSEFLSLVRKKNDFHFHCRVQREISTGIEDMIKIILRELGNRFKYIYIYGYVKSSKGKSPGYLQIFLLETERMDEFNFRTNWKNNLILVSYSRKPLLDNFGLLFSRIKGYDTIASVLSFGTK